MRPDQRQRLADVAERLAEVAIRDADPDHWTAPELTLAEMSKEQRGDAAWCRKTAALSLALLVRMEQLTASEAAAPGAPSEPDPEAEIRRAEKAADAALNRVMRGASAQPARR